MRKGRRERIEKGSHCFFKSSGYDKLELKHQHFFFQTYRMHYSKKDVMVKQKAKMCAIGEQNVMKIEVFILGGQRIYQKRKKGWWGEGEKRGLRKGAERW